MRRYRLSPITWILMAVIVAESIANNPYGSIRQWLIQKLMVLPGIILGLSLHEFAHAKAATLCGDSTPEKQGRLTTNPAAHLDPLGFFSLIFFGFGWGRPVEIDPTQMKSKRRDLFFVSVAGVAMNFLIAVIGSFLVALLWKFARTFFWTHSLGTILTQILENIIWINLVLMVFNLIPIPPLDGFNIVTEIFNLRQTKFYVAAMRYGYYVLLICIVFSITDRILGPAVQGLFSFLLDGFVKLLL